MTAISTRLSNGGHSKPQASASSAPSAAAGAVQPIEIEKLVGALTAEGREGALDIAAGLRVNATVGVMDDLPAMQQAAQTDSSVAEDLLLRLRDYETALTDQRDRLQASKDRYTSLLSLLERAVGSTRAFIVAADKALTDTQPQIRAVQNARATVERDLGPRSGDRPAKRVHTSAAAAGTPRDRDEAVTPPLSPNAVTPPMSPTTPQEPPQPSEAAAAAVATGEGVGQTDATPPPYSPTDDSTDGFGSGLPGAASAAASFLAQQLQQFQHLQQLQQQQQQQQQASPYVPQPPPAAAAAAPPGGSFNPYIPTGAAAPSLMPLPAPLLPSMSAPGALPGLSNPYSAAGLPPPGLFGAGAGAGAAKFPGLPGLQPPWPGRS